jgi:predicted DNA-binding transcriptional regulator AlpA
MNDIFETMVERWPSAIVARREVGHFTGGLLAPGTLANLDSRGEGPARKMRLGKRRVGYPVADFVEWLRTRAVIDEVAR